MATNKQTGGEVQEVEVSKIDLTDGLRPISKPHAAIIAESIRQNGQRQAIEIRPGKPGRFKVTFGRHRFWAVAQILQQSTIRAVVRNLSDTEARIAEIDENLIRHELNPLDRAVFLAERKALYEKLHPDAARGKAGAAARHHATEIISFARDAAERIGLTDRAVRLSVAIATGLSPEIRSRIAGTALSNRQVDLIALAKLSAAEQKRAVAGMLAAEPKWKSMRQAIDAIGGRTKKARTPYDSALAAVLRLPPRQQRQLIDEIARGLRPKEAAE